MAGAGGEPLVIGLGGNVGGETAVTERFRKAREALGVLGEVRSAPLYRTAPIGPTQPAFLNSALRLGVGDLVPDELIATVLELERLLGRDRRGAPPAPGGRSRRRRPEQETMIRWGPRTIDLDVLVWGSRVICAPDLEVPHPRLGERRFALAPLAALVGEGFEVPGMGAVGGLLARVRDQDVVEIAASW